MKGYKFEKGFKLATGMVAGCLLMLASGTSVYAMGVGTRDLYEYIYERTSVEEEIEEVETRIYNVRQQKISGDNIYQFLLYFDKLYDKFTDAEKKEFLNSFIERVDIYEQEQPDGRFLKHIKFRFPVYFNGKEIEEMSWDNETTVESCVLLCRADT